MPYNLSHALEHVFGITKGMLLVKKIYSNNFSYGSEVLFG